MCLNPVTITRNYPLIGTRQYVVPCGKCEECARKKQSEFGALALHEALEAGSLSFFTLTYRSETLPIAISVDTPEGDPQLIGFERGEPAITSGFGKEFMNRVVRVSSDYRGEFYNCASLHREDVKLWLKHFRRECERRFGEKPNMRYAIFGEYGEKRGRPHYHGLFFGLNAKQFQLLKDLWSDRFGFVYASPCPDHSCSLEEIKKISSYVSKYISKGVGTRWLNILPFVEPPRRQSSLNFGNFTPVELQKLAFFMMEAIYPSMELDLDFLPLMSWLSSQIDASLSLSLANPFLFPRD